MNPVAPERKLPRYLREAEKAPQMRDPFHESGPTISCDYISSPFLLSVLVRLDKGPVLRE